MAPNWPYHGPPNELDKAIAKVFSTDVKPFERHDMYGTFACNPIGWSTKLRLLLASILIVPAKISLAVFCVICYFLLCTAGNALLKEPYRAQFLVFWGKFWTRALAYAFGFWSIKWVRVGPDGAVSKGPSSSEVPFGGYVSNHCGWIDIIIYMSQVFPSFVAKKDVGDLPLVGVIAKAMQCLFVDRESRLAGDGSEASSGSGMSTLVRERMQRKASAAGSPELHMLLFPEGTTTNNAYLIPFKRGAFLAGVPVQPLLLQYDMSGRVWPTWDTIPGHLQIYFMLTELAFSVTVHQLPVYVPSAEEAADPTLYASNVRDLMAQYGAMQPSASTFADKVAYHKVVKEQYQLLYKRRQAKGAKARSGAAVAGAAAAANGTTAPAGAKAGAQQQQQGQQRPTVVHAKAA